MAPTGDAAIDQIRVARLEHLRAEARPLHRSRPEAFDQHVCAVDQLDDLRRPFGRFEINFHRGARAMEHIQPRLGPPRTTCRVA